MTSRNSTTDPGQPWVMTSGWASGSGERCMHEVDVLAVDRRREVVEGVESLLGGTPVVPVGPVLADITQVMSSVPRSRGRRGPLGQRVGAQTWAEIVEHVVGDLDAHR